MTMTRAPKRPSIPTQTTPARQPHGVDATDALKSLVDVSWDASAGTMANVHELSHLQAHTLANFSQIVSKAAVDSANSHEFQELVRANVDCSTALLAESAAFVQKLIGLTTAAQWAIARSAIA